MRAVVSRVRWARVLVDGETVGEIGGKTAGETGGETGAADGLGGLLVLLGVHRDDDASAVPTMARKLHELRVLGPGDRGDGEWARERSCAETGAGLLVVSQFTLYGDTRTGRRPSWSAAAPGDRAAALVDACVTALRERGAVVAQGRFGADMLVESANDGPFTVLVEV